MSQFELRPVGRTKEYIERDDIISKDMERAENYKKVKGIIDEYHKAFIEKALTVHTGRGGIRSTEK